MRFLFAVAVALCLTAIASAQPRYTVVNNTPPRYSVTNNCPCGVTCPCCPACPGSTAKAAPTSADTIRTASGRLIRPTATGYAYADEAEPELVVDCSGGKCKWVQTGRSSPSHSSAPSGAGYYSSPSFTWPSGFAGGYTSDVGVGARGLYGEVWQSAPGGGVQLAPGQPRMRAWVDSFKAPASPAYYGGVFRAGSVRGGCASGNCR